MGRFTVQYANQRQGQHLPMDLKPRHFSNTSESSFFAEDEDPNATSQGPSFTAGFASSSTEADLDEVKSANQAPLNPLHATPQESASVVPVLPSTNSNSTSFPTSSIGASPHAQTLQQQQQRETQPYEGVESPIQPSANDVVVDEIHSKSNSRRESLTRPCPQISRDRTDLDMAAQRKAVQEARAQRQAAWLSRKTSEWTIPSSELPIGLCILVVEAYRFQRTDEAFRRSVAAGMTNPIATTLWRRQGFLIDEGTIQGLINDVFAILNNTGTYFQHVQRELFRLSLWRQ